MTPSPQGSGEVPPRKKTEGLPHISPAVGVHPDEASWWERNKKGILGAPKNLWDRTLFHNVSLIPVLAWVGMGADGLSSSAYGPEESFRVLGEHLFLIPFIILAVIATISVISIAYSRIIEHFPEGGGGYVVATKLLGPGAGLVSGSALIVDYVLTISVSIAAGGDALFSILPPVYAGAKLLVEVLAIVVLLLLNLRGLKESVVAISPIFFGFVVSHVLMLLVSLGIHTDRFSGAVEGVSTGLQGGWSTMGPWVMFLIFLKAYSMGAGTYTGIEAISNGVGTLREPRAEMGKRTMFYMAASLAITSAGLLLCYLVAGVKPVEGKTLNAVLAQDAFGGGFLGSATLGVLLVVMTLLSEAGLLFIAAQTGFIDGPRVMATMAVDSWLPKRFSALSERLTMQNGVLLFGLGALATLLFTQGNTHILVVMYSINVFVTFCLSQLSMLMLYWRRRRDLPSWKGKIWIHVVGFVLCTAILLLMAVEKFAMGGWLTLACTGGMIAVCLWVRHYYRTVNRKIHKLDELSANLPLEAPKGPLAHDPAAPTAIVLVGSYGGVGIHSIFSILRTFPGHFKNMVFVSVGVVDSGNFKGLEALQDLKDHVEKDLKRYVELAQRLGIPASYEMAVGTDVVEAGAELCVKVAKRFSQAVVFGGKLVFQKERWYQRILHNETGSAIQNRLQWEGLPMTILPIRVFG